MSESSNWLRQTAKLGQMVNGIEWKDKKSKTQERYKSLNDDELDVAWGEKVRKRCEWLKKGQPDYLLVDDRGNERIWAATQKKLTKAKRGPLTIDVTGRRGSCSNWLYKLPLNWWWRYPILKGRHSKNTRSKRQWNETKKNNFSFVICIRIYRNSGHFKALAVKVGLVSMRKWIWIAEKRMENRKITLQMGRWLLHEMKRTFVIPESGFNVSNNPFVCKCGCGCGCNFEQFFCSGQTMRRRRRNNFETNVLMV